MRLYGPETTPGDPGKGLEEKNAERFCLGMDAGRPCSFCVLLGVRSAPKLLHFAPKIPGPPESMLQSQGAAWMFCSHLPELTVWKETSVLCSESMHPVQPEILQLQDLG